MSEGPWTVLERIATGERRPCRRCFHVHEYREDPDDKAFHTWKFCEAGCPAHPYEHMTVQEYAGWFLDQASKAGLAHE